METVIQIQWSAANIEEAKGICQELVEKRLIACANIVPQVESIYFWEGAVQTSSEVKVYLKTLDGKFEQVLSYIVENSSYDIPEITKIDLLEGYAPYLNWVRETVV